jgi:hypothetical protein
MAANTLGTSFTAEQLRAAIIYDPETGIFTWRYRPDQRKEWNSRFAGKPTGHRDSRHGEIRIGFHYGIYQAHRLAWLYMTGEWPPGVVDHKDCNPSNNVWTNLREATQRQNIWNSRIKSNNTSGYKGVTRDKKRWTARIMANYQKVHLGTFDTKEEAYEAYVEAAKRLHGKFARFG